MNIVEEVVVYVYLPVFYNECNNDLTHLDFSLWGYAKDRVYAIHPQNLEQLKTNIREVMAEILQDM